MGGIRSPTLSSSRTHGCHDREPKLIAPRMGTDTLKPLLPSCLYSALVPSMDRLNFSGMSSIFVVSSLLVCTD